MFKNKSKSIWVSRYLIIQPILFLFLAIFVLRTEVRLFLLLAVLMLIILAVLLKFGSVDHAKIFPLVLTTLSVIGLSSATILTVEKIELLENPNHTTSCSFSPIVACSPVIGSPQASAIDGLPNPIFGIFGFSCLLSAGMAMLAGASKLSKTYWCILFAGVCFGVVFCIWLFYQGVYEIGALCLYCLSVWLVTFTLFWLVLAQLISSHSISLNAKLENFIVKNKLTLITINLGIVALLLYFRWSDYWNSLF
jgi:uncharacterized membrane protein